MEDKENNSLVFKRSKTPNKKRASQKIVIRRQSRDLKQKTLPYVQNERNKLTEYFRSFQTNSKESMQQDIIKLKEKNNELSNENIRIKTSYLNIQKDNMRLQKMLVDGKSPNKLVENNLISLKQLLRDSKKELVQQKQQNAKIKKSLKFTKLSELESENACLRQQIERLRDLIKGSSKQDLLLEKQIKDESGIKRISLTLNKRIKSPQDKTGTQGRRPKNQNALIQNLKKTIKEKQQTIQSLKSGTKNSAIKLEFKKSQQLPTIKCFQCQKYKNQISSLYAKMKQKQDKQLCIINNNNNNLSNNTQSAQNIQSTTQSGFKTTRPAIKVFESLKLFLIFRFQAHHLSLNQLKSYIKQESTETISIKMFVDLCSAEPFCLVNREYMEAFLIYLFYDQDTKQITIKDNDHKLTSHVLLRLQTFLGEYNILSVKRQEEMYMQVAELITTYKKDIETALSPKRNPSDGTISKQVLTTFLLQIQLSQQYIDFMISQIILESIDLQHLSITSMFQIFTISPPSIHAHLSVSPYQIQSPPSKYAVMPVKQLDQQYQQSQQSQSVEIQNVDCKSFHNKQMIQLQQQCHQIQEYEAFQEQGSAHIE